jgi:hypothetical protein
MGETVSREKQRARRRRRVSYAIAVVVTLTLASVIYQQSKLLPARVAKYVNAHYLAGTPFQFSIDGISGSLVRRIVLKNPVLRYHSPAASYNVFRADQVSVTYELMPIFAFRLVVHDLELDGVALHLRQDENGRLVLPVPQHDEPTPSKRGVVSPVLDVQQFRINGLEMTFGGNQTHLAVRDVQLGGSCGYEKGIGRLSVEEGSAYLIDSGKTIESVRLSARIDGSSLFLDEFATRLEQSFVLASGQFRHGRFENVDLLLNPLSLGELHELGIAPDLDGVFSGHLALAGTVDSLGVSGTISGKGLGVELAGVQVEGTASPRGIDLRRLNGRVFGSVLDGRFRVDLPSENFAFDGTCRDLDLSRGFIEDSDLPPMSLNGRIRVDHDKAAGTYAWTADLGPSEVDGYESDAVSGEGMWRDETGLDLRRLVLDRPGYRVQGNGAVAPDGAADLLFTVDGTDLGYFWHHFELPPIEGAMAVSGRLQGPLDNFQVNLSGSVRDVRFEFMEVDSGLVRAEALGVGTEAPAVSVSLNGRHGAVWGQKLDAPALLIDVDTTSVRIHSARATRGDTTVVVDLDVRTGGSRSTILIRHAEIETPGDTWETVAPSVIRADDDGVVIDTLRFSSGRGEFGGAGSYRVRDKAMDLDFWGRDVDLSVLRDAIRASFQIHGRGDFGLSLEGSEENPRVRLDLDVVKGVIDSVSFDELRASASFDGSAYRVASLRLVAGGDTITARGEWASDVSPVRLGRGERPASMWSAPLSGEVTLAHFPLATLFVAMHRVPAVSADLTGTLVLSGTPESPVIAARGAVAPGGGPERELPPATVDAEYRDRVLRVSGVRVSDLIDLRISGHFPVTVSMRDGARLDADRPMDFRLDITPRGNDLSQIGRYVPSVASLKGEISGTVTGGGTPAVPVVTGGIALARGQLRMVGMQEAFTDLSARVDFVDDVVRITSLTARSGDKGSVVGTGWARISNYRPADYRVDLTLREFRLRSIPDVDVIMNGTLTARLHEWREGRKLPFITGALDIREATIQLDLAAGSGTGSALALPTDDPGWIGSVDLSAAKNVWVRNPDLNVELAGNVILKHDESGMYFRGDMSVLRGSYRLYGNKFTITTGSMDFSASETMRPAMYIEAYTPHRTADGPDRNIYLTLSWPYDKKEPQISLTYDEPGYSEADIWRMLGGSMFASGIATNALERMINDQMTGFTVDVEQRSVEGQAGSGSALEQETLIGVGRYLWEDVYLQYKRGLSIGSEQEVNVEYRLSNKFLLRSQFIYNSRRNLAGIAGQDTDEFNLDLKYRFEY